MVLQLKNDEGKLSTPQGFEQGPLEPKASVLPMGYTDLANLNRWEESSVPQSY